MCICFVHINDDPAKYPFRICLATNRDQPFNRPAERLSRWPSPNSDIIGGRDLTPGKENGTWLAVNSANGKIALLLNLRDRSFPEDSGLPKRGRGALVPDFLRSSLSAEIFTADLIKQAKEYEPFLLLMLQPNANDGSYEGHFLSSLDSQHKVFKSGRGGKSFGFGNSHPDRPFLKVSVGLELFDQLLAPFQGVSSSEADAVGAQLVDGLFELLSQPNQHFPDPALEAAFPIGFPEAYLLKLSSINVSYPERGYGTRTQTLVFVGFDGKATMVEKDIMPDDFRLERASAEQLIRLDFNIA